MKQKIILILAFWISFHNCISAQSPEEIPAFAESLLIQDNYDGALKEYLRAHFLGIKSKNFPVSKRISDLFVMQGNYKKALQFLDYYYFENKTSPEIQANISLDKAKIYLLQKDTKFALFELFQVNSASIKDKDRLHFYTGLALLYDHQYADGLGYWKKISYVTVKDQISFEQLVKKLEKNEKKNPNRARWLSAVVPGLGQIVNGDVKDGMISMALIGSLTYVFFDVANSLSYGDAFLSVGPWWGRYMLGGMSNAVKQAKKIKEDRHLEYIRMMVDDLETMGSNRPLNVKS